MVPRIVVHDVYSGELPNFPAAGWDPIEPDWLDFKLASMVKLQGLDGGRDSESDTLPSRASP